MTVSGDRPIFSVVLPARLDATNAGTVVASLLERLRAAGAGQGIQVDAGALQSFDSSALAALLEVQRTALQHGATMELQRPPVRLIELARLYGVQDLLPSSEPAEAAPVV